MSSDATPGRSGAGPVSAELLSILACPVPACHAPLELRADRLVCTRCRLRYRVEAQWPVLIPEEADPPEAA